MSGGDTKLLFSNMPTHILNCGLWVEGGEKKDERQQEKNEIKIRITDSVFLIIQSNTTHCLGCIN